MVIYTIGFAVVYVLSAVFSRFDDVTTVFGLENYVAQISGTVQAMAEHIPVLSTFFTAVSLLLAVYSGIFMWRLVIRIIRLLRG